jgi:hypothetical protein
LRYLRGYLYFGRRLNLGVEHRSIPLRR